MAEKLVQISHPKSNRIAELTHLYRKKSGLSRNQLAMLAGVGRTAIFDIEHGKTTFQIDTLLKIFEVLNLKLYAEGPFNEELK